MYLHRLVFPHEWTLNLVEPVFRGDHVLLSSSHVDYVHVFSDVEPSPHSGKTAFVLMCRLVLLARILCKVSARISTRLHVLFVASGINFWAHEVCDIPAPPSASRALSAVDRVDGRRRP